MQDDVTLGLTVHGEAYQYDGLHRVNDYGTSMSLARNSTGARERGDTQLGLIVGEDGEPRQGILSGRTA